MSSSFVYAAVRTPFGRFNGALAEVRPDDLAAVALTGVLDKTPDLDPEQIGDVVWGNANGAGEDNRNVGRMAVLLAGLPTSVPATTVNRLCGSSLDAAMIGSRTIETGDAEVVLAGGVESMTRAPWVLPKPSRAFPAGNVTAVSTTLGWRLVNERMPQEWTVSLGEANEQLQERFGISRERQDEFAARSHNLADEAWNAGFYDDLVVRVPGKDGQSALDRDEGIRPGSSAEKLAGLKPSFRPDGTITAGNASPLNDGASALVLGSEAAASTIGRDPIARIAGRGVARAGAAGVRLRAGRGGREGAPAGRDRLVRRRRRSSSTRRSRCSRWPASTPGRSTRRSSTPRAARSRSATRSAPPAAGSSARSRAACRSPATGGASPRSASASARRWPSCSRTSRRACGDHDLRDDRRGGRRNRATAPPC